MFSKVLCGFFLLLLLYLNFFCNVQVHRYAQMVQEKTCYCHLPYMLDKSFKLFKNNKKTTFVAEIHANKLTLGLPVCTLKT